MATAVESAIEGNSTREAISFCRICSGGCGVVLTIDSNDRTATFPLLRFASVIVIAAVNDVFPWST